MLDDAHPSPAALFAALERLYADAGLPKRISDNARCFWERHFSRYDDVARRVACGLAARAHLWPRNASGPA